MKYLTIDNFIQKDGLSFENLIKNLLKEEYGDSFVPTPYTNDGGKDFVSKDKYFPNSKIWAECKMYTRKSLSFNDVSKTLLMAYIEEINKLIFFSFSPVNKRFEKHIENYKSKTNIEVEIYDDIVLEALIFKYKNKKWFNQYITFDTSKDNIAIDGKFQIFYKLADDYTEDKETQKIRVNLNDLIVLDVLMSNRSLEPKKYNIDISSFDDFNFYEIINKEEIDISGTIPAAQTKKISLVIRILYFKNKYKIPNIKVNNKMLSIQKTLHTTWLAQIPFIGEQNLAQLEISKNLITNNKKLSMLVIKGSTGIGKTRFTKELAYNSISNGNNYYIYDADKQSTSFSILIKELFSYFSNLPFFAIEASDIASLINTDKNSHLSYASKVLYDKEFNFDREFDQITDWLLGYFRIKATNLFFENVQRYDETSINLINRIVDFSINTSCNSSLVMTYNTDEVTYNRMAKQLLDRVQQLSLSKNDQYRIIELSELDYSDMITFLSKSLQIERNELRNYPNFINKVENNVGFVPSRLNNYFIYLKENNIIYFDNGSIQFNNLDFFYDTEYYKDNLFETYSRIIEELGDNFKNFVSILGFCKFLPKRLVKSLGYDIKDINSILIDLGIVAYDFGTSTYYFRHNSLRIFFKRKYPIEDGNVNLVFLKRVLELTDMQHYAEQIFIIDFLKNEKIDSVRTIIDKIIHREIDPEFAEEIFNIFSSSRIEHFLQLNDYMNVLISIAHSATLLLGLPKSIKYYERVLSLTKKNQYTGQSMWDSIILAFKEYLRHLMNTNNLENALIKLQEMQALSTTVPDEFLSKYITELEKINILCFYKQGHTKIAINRALNLIKKFPHNRILKSECHILIGKAIYRSENFLEGRDIIVKHWNSAFYDECITDYFDSQTVKKSVIIDICIRKIIAVLINDKKSIKLQDIRNCVEFLNDIIDRTQMVYFEVKIRQVLSIYYHYVEQKTDKAISLIIESISILQFQYGNQYLYMDSLLILAQIYKAEKDYERMYNYYVNFISQFSKSNYERNNYNLQYMTLQLVTDIKKFSVHYSATFNWNLIKNIDDSLYKKIQSIRTSNDVMNIPSKYSLIYNSKNDCSYPMI